jgi:hypothetical protein
VNPTGNPANLTRTGVGRKKGVPNKATAEIKALCREHAPSVIKELARLSLKGRSEQARVAAAKELLDRGFGKSVQPHDGDGEGGAIKLQVNRIERVVVDPLHSDSARVSSVARTSEV